MTPRVAADEGSITLYGIILLVVILVTLTAFALLVFPTVDTGSSAYSWFQGSADNMVLVGGLTGYPDNNGLLGQVTVANPNPDPNAMGALLLNIRLDSVRMVLDSSSGVDLDKSTVTITSLRGVEQLRETETLPMKNPGWTIAAKTGTLPYQSADADNILEPNEAFSLFMYPAHALPPLTQFTIVVTFADGKQITTGGVVPAVISPVMNFPGAGTPGPV